MTTTGDTFTDWLNGKLRELNTDESVFGSYIISILDSDETQDEKSEALEGILGEILTDNIQEVIASIKSKWFECHPREEEAPQQGIPIDVDEQLVKLLEAQKLQATAKERQYTEEERRIREQILTQYSQTAVSDEEFGGVGGSDEEANKHTVSSGLSGIERNTNVHDVIQLQKERREQARQDAAAKKQKDKEDRERQRQLREEKKEKRKTVKSERRR